LIADEAPEAMRVSIKKRFLPRWKSVPMVTMSVHVDLSFDPWKTVPKRALASVTP